VTENPSPYPVRVDASLEPVSRGLWLVKWLLLIPHFILLSVLWLAFAVLSVIAFVAILFTGRYPRAIFDFNVGVLRWSWRVHYYGYGALGTDRYPPFTLADVPDYPAHVEVDYPERLSRGLVLVKWWLLAIPHLIILAVFIGGGAWLGGRSNANGWEWGWGAGGLVGLLVLIAALVLLFTGRYPRSLYDLVMGMDRWALRVAAYVGLMRDEYPPFRLDVGGADPGSVPAGLPPSPPSGPSAAAVPPWPPSAPAAVRAGSTPARGGWTGGRITSVVIGAVLLFASAGLFAGGGTLLWAQGHRSNGYVTSPSAVVGTAQYAVTSDNVELQGAGVPSFVQNILGTTRLQAASTDPGVRLFVGIGRTADVSHYLSGVGQLRLRDLGTPFGGANVATGSIVAGGAPAGPPAGAGIWVAQASGAGAPTVTWRPSTGNWTAVIMRADGAAGVRTVVRVGATAPGLPWIAAGVLALGALFLLGGALLVGLAARAASRGPSAGAAPPFGAPSPRRPSESELAAAPVQREELR
jgi:hypothetical protein